MTIKFQHDGVASYVWEHSKLGFVRGLKQEGPRVVIARVDGGWGFRVFPSATEAGPIQKGFKRYVDVLPVATAEAVKIIQEAIQPKLTSVKQLSTEAYGKFLEVYTALSPENLTCDGELSRTEVRKRYDQLQKQLAVLCIEYNIDKQVATEDAVWGELQNRRKEPA